MHESSTVARSVVGSHPIRVAHFTIVQRSSNVLLRSYEFVLQYS